MFTPGQVSDMLEVPPSTLRRYVKQFETHLSALRQLLNELFVPFVKSTSARRHTIRSLFYSVTCVTCVTYPRGSGDLLEAGRPFPNLEEGLRKPVRGRAEADDFVVLPAAADEALRAWLVDRGQRKKGPLFWSLSRQNPGDRLSTRAIRGTVKDRFSRAGVVNGGKTTHSLRRSA